MTEWLYGLLLCLALISAGVWVWRNGKVRFFSGIDAGAIRNEKLLAKRIGLSIISFGLELLFLLSIHIFLYPVPALWIGILAVLHIIHILLLGINDQKRK